MYAIPLPHLRHDLPFHTPLAWREATVLSAPAISGATWNARLAQGRETLRQGCHMTAVWAGGCSQGARGRPGGDGFRVEGAWGRRTGEIGDAEGRGHPDGKVDEWTRYDAKCVYADLCFHIRNHYAFKLAQCAGNYFIYTSTVQS